MITLDGGQGEGGGQIVRTALTLSCVLGVPVGIQHIRAGRNPAGLRHQHVTAIQAAAEICGAKVSGAQPGSEKVTFEPGGAVQAGSYEWMVGTAGATTLVLQTVLLPLALANGVSEVRIHGGTHVPNSPSGHYIRDVFVPMLLSLGADVQVFMETYGWVPEGGGILVASIAGNAKLQGQQMVKRGPIERIVGSAIGCNLPSNIPQRIANRAINLLEAVDAPLDIRPMRTKSVSTGAGIFLTAEYNNGRGGFGVLGRKGMPSEVVAEQAVTALLDFHGSGAAVDERLADQLIVPLVLAEGESRFSTPTITDHLRTNIHVVNAFLDRSITIEGSQVVIGA
ncbi:MAG TPA: RNA 3'-terminal phosphate cyclase [Aggregatilineaceae bacterium]|nr:RNA 3'-terminal phosphate cyclase [Aggregatilineaceae bacterium]